MQWLWILPSVGYGVYMFVSTGQAYGLIFGALSLIAMLGGSLLQRRAEPVDASGEVRFGAGRVALGARVLPRWQWRWQAAWVSAVYRHLAEANAVVASRQAVLQRLAGRLNADSPAGSLLPAWLGYAGTAEVVLDLPQEGGHGIIVGATGAGKSQLLTLWLVSLCQGFTPGQLGLCLIDFKGGAALSPFAKLPHARGFVTDLDGGLADVLAELDQQLVNREHALAKAGAAELSQLPRHARPERLLVVIDELQALLLAHAAAQPTLEAIAARGRSLGVHLVVTAQSLIGIPRGLLANLGVRILVGRADAVDLAQLGYSRPQGGLATVGASVTGASAGTTHQHSSPETQWGEAVMVTPERQLKFGFPSRGSVSPVRASHVEPKLLDLGF